MPVVNVVPCTTDKEDSEKTDPATPGMELGTDNLKLGVAHAYDSSGT